MTPRWAPSATPASTRPTPLPSSASGVGDVLHSVFAGVGRLFSSLFGR
jgi:hypothetical protein